MIFMKTQVVIQYILITLKKCYDFTLIFSFCTIILALLTVVDIAITHQSQLHLISNIEYIQLLIFKCFDYQAAYFLLSFIVVFPLAFFCCFLIGLFYKFFGVEDSELLISKNHWFQKVMPYKMPFLSALHVGFITGMSYEILYNQVTPDSHSPLSFLQNTIIIQWYVSILRFFHYNYYIQTHRDDTIMLMGIAVAFSLTFDIAFILRLIWLFVVKRKSTLLSCKPV